MKRIVNSEEMKACDRNTIMHFGVPSLVLMERAALCVVEEVVRELPDAGSVLIVCGNGNNGADGLAAARLLYQRGYTVAVVQVPDHGKRSPENQTQRDILQQYGINITEQIPDADYDCIIDALFGVGLSRAPEGIYAQFVTHMNQMGGLKIAVDLPSGVSSDDGRAYVPSFDADLTVTFAYQKAGQILYPGREKCGKLVLADIGITDESWLERKPSCFVLEPDDLKQIPQRPLRSNKGTFGHVLAAAGSKNMAGAALFCAQAAYGAGCGLVKIFTSEANRVILQSTLPEAILSTYDETRACNEAWTYDETGADDGAKTDGETRACDEAKIYDETGTYDGAKADGETGIYDETKADGETGTYDETKVCDDSFRMQESLAEALKWADAVILGPGIGKSRQAYQIVEQVLLTADVPVVVDADALNILAEHLQLLERTAAKLILTPHPGEMARLCKKQVPDILNTMRQTAEEFALQHHLVCVLKDAVTVTAGPSGTWLNTSGCSAMAKGGSGDVLAGIIASFISQGMVPEEAARMGVYVHGLAGEAAAKQKGEYSVLARDIINALGRLIDRRQTRQ